MYLPDYANNSNHFANEFPLLSHNLDNIAMDSDNFEIINDFNSKSWNKGQLVRQNFHKCFFICVTNITLLGLAMVNWSIGLLLSGGNNSYHGISSCTGPL